MRDIPAVAMEWRDGLFAHWPVDPSRVRSLVPDELDVDARDGTAWVSALPSVVVATRPWFLPERAGVTFPQVNLRTYVRHETRPGVYFLSLDTTTTLGVRVARTMYGLPYYRAEIDFERAGDGHHWRNEGGDFGRESTGDAGRGQRYRFDCQRLHHEDPPARFAAEYRPTGRPSRADSESLAEFLTERYRAFMVRDGTVWCARVEHAPWRLCPAEATVHADALLEAAGLPAPSEDPMVHYSPGTSFTIRTPFRP